MRRLVALAGLLLLAGVLRAQDAPSGTPQPDAPLRDADFGVRVRQFGLERRVEMLQWQATPGGYARVWSDEPIDASHYDRAHANPVDWPLPGRRWLAKGGTLDDAPLDPDVIATLGQWQDFRPSFDALPPNMAATFQPEGDGLGSADNPLAPEVGDLRIRWRELVLPPLQGRVRLVDGSWRLAPATPDPEDDPAAAATPVAVAPAPSQPPMSNAKTTSPALRWWLGSGAVIVLVIAMAARRRRGKD